MALLAINTDRSTTRTLTLPAAERYTLSALGGNTRERRVHLNVELALGPNDELPEFKPEATAEGAISLAPATITVLAISNAVNAHADDCRGFRNAAGGEDLTISPPEPDTNDGAKGLP